MWKKNPHCDDCGHYDTYIWSHGHLPIYSGIGVGEFIEQHIGLMAAAGAAFCVLVYIISYFVSLSIFNKKEY